MKGLMKKIPDECCEYYGNDKILVCQENKRKFVMHNNSGRNLLKIRVDGCLITSGTRCDFAVDDNSTDVYLIELKGKDLRKACIQLKNSYKYFKKNFSYKTIHCRVVLSKISSPAVASCELKEMLKMVKEEKISFKYKNDRLDEILE
ncbi:hypothetical protein C5N99_01375 [Treponema medium]|uniref:Uncharacterized protein n=2 Tax=Treponema medium TaxID=58231 RepID=A0AA87NRT7_TREMD|nr:hypothetical protein [Treponema medium]EPF29566.1 hypothetical protein HMPREF9195_00267 [Treponema medium ATCC 700293]QSH91295.1 hypothetical protein C5N99_01375 [Treponema medium]QSH96427.1 hypothetical protein DWB79_01340 [Treponema medium]